MIHVLMFTKQSKHLNSSTWETTPKDHGSQRPSFFRKKFFTERLVRSLAYPGRWRSPWMCSRNGWMWPLVPWSSGKGGVCLWVGLDELRGPFQPNWSCNSVIPMVWIITEWLGFCLIFPVNMKHVQNYRYTESPVPKASINWKEKLIEHVKSWNMKCE